MDSKISEIINKVYVVLCDETRVRWHERDMELWANESLSLNHDESAAIDYVCWKATVMTDPDSSKQFMKMAIMKIFFGDK